ncbi:MAG TPA: tol-pal system protein YbgF [Dongiaceae bacterium]|nr:tol-pal system protein YbgF [Dongiaceae bacterium]
MRRLAAFWVLMAATTVSVVAAPPYESRERSKSSPSIDPSSPYYSPSQSNSSGSGATYGSGVTTYGVGGGDGSESSNYAKPADSGRSSSSYSSTGGGSDSYSTMQQMQQMQQELQELRGAVEQLTHDMEMMQKQARERYLDLDSRINQLRGGTAAAGAAVAAEGDAPVAAPTTQEAAQDKDLYDKASQLRRDGKYQESITVLEDLLKQSPDGPYAPYCEYWLGETYMAIKPPKLDMAKTHFISLLGNHPDHVKVPDAMYKLGKLFASQGEKAKAKGTLNELIKKHPDKPAANLAKDLLKTL